MPARAAAERLDATVANMRFVKPLDAELVAELARTHDALVTVEDAVRHAADAGLVLESDTDLTPYLELRRPRDRAISVAVALARGPLRPRSEYWRMLAGGDALQHCLTGGLIDYRLLVLTRPVAAQA